VSNHLEKSVEKEREPVGEHLLGDTFSSPHQQLRRTTATVNTSVYQLGQQRLQHTAPQSNTLYKM